MRPDADAWLRRFAPAPTAEVRLLVLPHAGGSASFYLPVSHALAPRVEVVTAQYPGRQDRHHERPLPTIAAIADELAEVVSGLDDLPLLVFGHSMGAVVGYELAQRRAPLRLFASGRRAPSRHRSETVHLRDDRGIIAELRSLSGSRADALANPEVMQMAMPAVRADYRAIETYRHGHDVPLDCPVTVFTGDADPQVTLEEARAWRDHTTAGFDMHILPGGHFFIVEQAPQVIQVMAAAASAVARA
ncbi:thioesterase II family protein [Micromonospora sp. NPDC049175]|uniref:thioesterase II family protein n=1 Tax=Micromonospora sp. NPDC049175 TaxID=3364266 RepID=UPI00371CB1DE